MIDIQPHSVSGIYVLLYRDLRSSVQGLTVPHLVRPLLRLDPSPAAPLASDNLISLLEGAFSFAIFTRLPLVSRSFLQRDLQS